jgi:hypothetical protein
VTEQEQLDEDLYLLSRDNLALGPPSFAEEREFAIWLCESAVDAPDGVIAALLTNPALMRYVHDRICPEAELPRPFLLLAS